MNRPRWTDLRQLDWRRPVGIVLLSIAALVGVFLFKVQHGAAQWAVESFVVGILVALYVIFANGGIARRVPVMDYLVPTMLPSAPRPFVGRGAEMATVVEQLSAAVPTDGRPIRVVISGPAGIGKTAFAVKVAHDLAEKFPAGQLFADCRIRTTGEITRADIDQRVTETLANFVTALQYQAETVPDGRAERAERYRELTSDRQVLVVLDDTDDESVVRALSPAGPRCAVIVTCRDVPAWLSATDRHIPLDVLAKHDALQLLRDIAGDRINREEESASKIVVSAHPLAVRAAATAIAARPMTSLASALNRLEEQRSMPAGADRALDFTYALLTLDEKAAVRMIGLLGLSQFPAWKLGAVLAVDERAAERLANRLVSSGLLSRSSEDAAGVPVFEIHDHILRYARARYDRDEADDPTPTEERLRALHDRDRERRAFGVDNLNLETMVYLPMEDGDIFGALDAARTAVGAARDSDDAQARGLALAALAEVQTELGNADSAVDLVTLVLRDEATAGLSRARALRCLGRISRRHRQLEAADRHLVAALAACDAAGDTAERAKILAEHAIVYSLRGQASRARSAIETAWALRLKLPAPEQPAPFGRIYVESRLRWAAGFVYHEVGDERRALATLRGDVPDCPSQGHAPTLAYAWLAHRIGWSNLRDRPQEALVSAAEGQELFGAMNHRYGKAHCRNVMGQAHLNLGAIDLAVPLLARALENFNGCGDRWEEARSALVLASAYSMIPEQVAAARRLRESALDIYLELGDAAQVRAVRKLLGASEAGPGPEPRLRMPSGLLPASGRVR